MKFSMATLSTETVSEFVTRQRVCGEKLECILYAYKPGARFPVHDHESEQITYVLDGELVFEPNTLAYDMPRRRRALNARNLS